jgi:hypothetical protein
MKTFNQFNEDIEQRRAELSQKQRERASDFVRGNKEKAQAQIAQQQAQRDADTDRENMKREIKNELRRER